MRAVGGLMAISMLVWTFRQSEPARVGALLQRVGGAGFLLLVPHLLALMVESAGWQLAFQRMGRRLPFLGLLRARLATEALAQTLPLGVVISESIKPVLLARHCGADLSTSLAGMAARKWLLVGSQSLYVGGFALLSWPLLTQISSPVLHAPGLPWLLLGAAGLLISLAVIGFVLLSRGGPAERICALLARLPIPWLRAKLERSRVELGRTDGRIQRFFASALVSPAPLFVFLLGWLIEASETFLILRLLGVELSWLTVGSIEVTSSFLRSLVVIVPAGLGVQDLSYVAFLRALAVPDALNVAAAFLLLKRAKETFWAAFGYGLLALEMRAAAPARSLRVSLRDRALGWRSALTRI